MNFIRLCAWAGLLTVSFAVNSCGGVNDPDESAFVEQIGFNQPVTVTAKLRGLRDYREGMFHHAFRGRAELAVIAALVKAGYVEVGPDTTSAPWWKLTAGGLVDTGGGLAVKIGRRVIASRSEVERWEEGSASFFAETIEYNLQMDEPLAAVSGPQLGPFSVRLVLIYHPAVGHWEYHDSSTALPLKAEADAVSAELDRVWDGTNQQLAGYLLQASAQAADLIESQLAQDGIIARSSKTPNVLESTANKLAYYIEPHQFPYISPDEFKNYCDGLSVEGYGPWRVPTWAELDRLFAARKFPDAPDGRLWGGMGTPPADANKTANFWSASISGGSYADRCYQNQCTIYEVHEEMYSPFLQGFYMKNDTREVVKGGTWLQLSYAKNINQIRLDNGSSESRVICIAALP